MVTVGDVSDAWLTAGPAFDGIAQAAAELAVKWVREGRYCSVEEVIEPAILVFATAVEMQAPHVTRLAVAEYDQALADRRDARR